MVKYMRAKGISKRLQLKVRTFFYYLWHENKIKDESAERKIIDKLPRRLRGQLRYDDYKKYTASIQIFAYLPKQSLVAMLEQVREVRYNKGQTLTDVKLS